MSNLLLQRVTGLGFYLYTWQLELRTSPLQSRDAARTKSRPYAIGDLVKKQP